MTVVDLASCKISDNEAQLLATVLNRLKKLDGLYLNDNYIHDSAIAIAEALLGLPQLRRVHLQGNPIHASVYEALDKKTRHISRPGGGSLKVFCYYW